MYKNINFMHLSAFTAHKLLENVELSHKNRITKFIK